MTKSNYEFAKAWASATSAAWVKLASEVEEKYKNLLKDITVYAGPIKEPKQDD